MNKLHLILATIYVCIHFLISMIFGIIPGTILRSLGLKKIADRYIRFSGVLLSRGIVVSLGGYVTVKGRENIPKDNMRLCFVSNHKSLTDIPLVVGYLPVPLGFIAKKELHRVPILRTWMDILGCVYIDRSDLRSQIKAILDGVSAIKAGHPQLIFPEGTRSKSESFGTFKPGSIKLATRAKAIILPLTINNTSFLLESKTRIRRQKLELIIHEPIDTSKLSDEELKDLPEKVFSIIKQKK
jgi:1-acyl-sn-glycerol-3-phosphate acyltransferase